jgi:hypothetical protein
MNRKRMFLVSGLRPAFGKQVNDFVAALDLGISGGYVRFSHKTVITLGDGVTQDQLDRQPDAVRTAYEQSGCINVRVREIGENGE